MLTQKVVVLVEEMRFHVALQCDAHVSHHLTRRALDILIDFRAIVVVVMTGIENFKYRYLQQKQWKICEINNIVYLFLASTYNIIELAKAILCVELIEYCLKLETQAEEHGGMTLGGVMTAAQYP